MSDNLLKKRDFTKDDSAMLERAFFDNERSDISTIIGNNSTLNDVSIRKGSVELGSISVKPQVDS